MFFTNFRTRGLLALLGLWVGFYGISLAEASCKEEFQVSEEYYIPSLDDHFTLTLHYTPLPGNSLASGAPVFYTLCVSLEINGKIAQQRGPIRYVPGISSEDFEIKGIPNLWIKVLDSRIRKIVEKGKETHAWAAKVTFAQKEGEESETEVSLTFEIPPTVWLPREKKFVPVIREKDEE